MDMSAAMDMAGSKKWREGMANSPAPFPEVGRRAIDILTKDYNYDIKLSLSIPSYTRKGLTVANGVKNGQIVAGDVSTRYRTTEKSIVHVRFDACSNIISRLSFNVSTGTIAAITFVVPHHKFSQVDAMYLHRHAVIRSSVGLNARPRLKVSAAIGSKSVAIGGDIAFDTSSSSFTKCDAAISFNNPGSSAAIILTDKGQTVKAMYTHLVNPVTGTEIATMMTHALSSSFKKFLIGSVHKVDSKTLIKTRCTSSGYVGVLCQREWSPKRFLTVSATFDIKAITRPPVFGLNIALNP